MRCVYLIKCLYNNKVYIGSTEIFQIRIEEHFRLLEENKHYNNKMQKDYIRFKKYFIVGIVKEFSLFESRDMLYDLEQELIDSVPDKYNINLNAREHMNPYHIRKEHSRQMKINFHNI